MSEHTTLKIIVEGISLAATLEAVSEIADLRRRSGIELRTFAGPAAFAGTMDPIRIAHLTDLHVGRVTPMRVQLDAVAIANASNPDLVVITGDFVCHSQLYLDALKQVIEAFTAPVICVLGNHDYWSGADEVRHTLRAAGALVLANQNTVITIRNQAFQLVGLDDAYTGHAHRDDAVRGMRRDIPTLGLSHIAEEADALWREGVPLVLSGHTHAGQVTVARLHELAVGRFAGHKYVHGLYGTRTVETSASGAVYVGAGIGAAVMPLRLGERGRREVTIFELGAMPGAFAEHHTEQPALVGRKPPVDLVLKRREAVAKKKEKRERRTAGRM